jgi:hypothetical protein
MRRALVIAGVMLAGLVASVPAPATAAAPPSLGISEISRTSIGFHFHRGPYLVYVEMEGPGNKLALTVVRHGASADYRTKPHFEGRSVRARFGRLGSLDLTFTPSPGKVQRCGTIVQSQGIFTGDFRFTGEHRYIHFDVHRIDGEHTTAGSCSSGRLATDLRARRGRADAEARGATLEARTAGPWPLDTIIAEVYRGVRGFEGVVAGFRWERGEGMEVIRGAQIGIGRDRFRWDLDAGTASLRPPVPFTGSATFSRRPDGRARWSGSLRVPILGGRPLALTGPRFHAHLRAGTPFE